MIRSDSLTPPAPPRRTGATLVEVLMALLIMAIGVTSVFTLFPLAILKAVKAHQLTDAKLYENAIKDTLLTHSQLWTGAPEWSENTWYARAPLTATVQDRWVSPKRGERLVPDTNQLFVCPPNSPAGFVSSAALPDFGVQTRQDWNANLVAGGYQNIYALPPIPDPLRPLWWDYVPDPPPPLPPILAWYPYRHSPSLTNTTSSTYVVDPLGWHNQDSASPDRYLFGRIVNGDVTSVADTLNMDRIHCQIGLDAAKDTFQLADTWNEVLARMPVEVTIPAAPPNRLNIRFPDIKPDLIDAGTMGALNRVVLNSTVTPPATSTVNPHAFAISTSGSSNPSPDTLQVVGALPLSYTSAPYSAASPFTVDLASIEVRTQGRYSWLMSVHSTAAGNFSAQCAVVLNRTFEVADEQGYRAEFCATETPADDMLPNGRIDTNIAKVRWPKDDEAPRIKEGGYIFDASHGYWYQIKKVEKLNGEEQQLVTAADVPNAAGPFLRTIVSLNDAVKDSSGPTFTDYQTFSAVDTITPNPQVDCQAVLLPGVIHVFSMTPESTQ